MCLAGMEDDVKTLAKSVATKADVTVLDARIDHGHLNMLVEHRGWIRSADLLAEHGEEPFEDRGLLAHPAVRHARPHVPMFLAR